MPKLYPYQIEGALWLAKAKRLAVLHWDMRVGKTPTAIRACDHINAKRILILCPAAICFNWRREFETWQQNERDIQVISSGKDHPTGDVIIVSYTLAINPILHQALSQVDWDVVILDEIQYLKSLKANRTKAILGFGAYRGRGLVDGVPHVFGLSGTPAVNNLSELYPWLKSCAPEVLANGDGRPLSYARFIDRYCLGYQTQYGFKITGNNKNALSELTARLAPIMHRKSLGDVAPDLPPLLMTQIEVEGDDLIKDIHDLEAAYRDDVMALLDGGKITEHVARLRRITEMAKVKAAAQMIRAELNDGAYKKIVIFAHHRDVIKTLKEWLSDFDTVVVHGGTANRQDAIDRFHGGDAQIFIGQIVAAGTGITLNANGRCSNAIFLSLSFVPGENVQAAARILNPIEKVPAFARVLHLLGSIDEDVNRILLQKTRMLDELFETQEVA